MTNPQKIIGNILGKPREGVKDYQSKNAMRQDKNLAYLNAMTVNILKDKINSEYGIDMEELSKMNKPALISLYRNLTLRR